MSSRISLLVLALLFGGCAKNKPVESFKPTEFPKLSQGQKVAQGVLLSKMSIPTSEGNKQVWVYVPENATGQLPLILIAPAGSRMFHGMGLGDGDMPEHLPYVQNGYAVVSYEIDGPMGDNASDSEAVAAAQAFQKANAGINNGKLALDYALAQLPIDPQKVYTAGHSSAATLSLQLAENDPRIKGCIAYAPVADIPKRLGSEAIKELDGLISGFGDFLKDVSPVTHLDRLKCPVFLFHAEDDSNIPFTDAKEFADQLKGKGVNVTFETTPTGNHYDSMIQVGIPKALSWLRGLKPGQ